MYRVCQLRNAEPVPNDFSFETREEVVEYLKKKAKVFQEKEKHERSFDRPGHRNEISHKITLDTAHLVLRVWTTLRGGRHIDTVYVFPKDI